MHLMKNYSGEGGDHYVLEGSPNIKYSELRFIEDDIDNLVNAGLITVCKSPKNNITYTITRQAVRFIDAIDSK